MTFLKKSVDALHNKLKREQDEHVRSRIAVMETNHKLINEITGDNGLKKRIESLTDEFKKQGSSNKLREIKKKLMEREKMLEQIEQSEKTGTLPSSRSVPHQDA